MFALSNLLRLRQLSLKNDQGNFIVFVALSDEEATRVQNTKGFSGYEDRVVHSVRGGHSSLSDVSDAKNAFNLRFGKVKSSTYQIG